MSLLSYLFPRINGSQEDVATLALEYILNQDDRLSVEFTTLVCNALNIPAPKSRIIFKPQATGENKERPDLAGCDTSGKEIILFEEKFYASLTPNQPNGYLDRLQKNNGLGLVFICPKTRLNSLFSQLFSLCPDARESNENCFISGSGIPVALLSWFEVLDALKASAEKLNPMLVSDIEQLRDFCKLVDSDEYPPFEPSDLYPDMPKKMERYQAVIDRVAEKMFRDTSRHASPGGLKRSASIDGFSRYFIAGNYSITLRFSRSLWSKPGIADTPFWFGADLIGSDASDIFSELPISQKRKSPDPKYGTMLYALDAISYHTMDEVAEDLLRQIDEMFAKREQILSERAGE